jgi:hypothetical protein
VRREDDIKGGVGKVRSPFESQSGSAMAPDLLVRIQSEGMVTHNLRGGTDLKVNRHLALRV